MEEETVTITLKEHEELKAESAWLQSLVNAGVDNWPGISFAWELYEEDFPEYYNKGL